MDMMDKTSSTHLHIHLYEDRTALATLTESVQQLKELIMASQAQFEAGFERLNQATNAVAEVLRKHVEAAKVGMTPEQEDAALKNLLAAADSLEQMGKTPADPVPEPPPEPIVPTP